MTAEDQIRMRDRLSADSLTSRRDYLRVMATVSGGLVVGSVAVSAGVLPRHGDATAADVQPMKVTDLLQRGQAVTFTYPTEHDRAIAIPLRDGTLVGHSTVCTHLACGVLWRKDRGQEGELFCPWHEGAFEPREGAVVQGPPPRGLPKVLLAERADGREPPVPRWPRAICGSPCGALERLDRGVRVLLHPRDVRELRSHGLAAGCSSSTTPCAWVCAVQVVLRPAGSRSPELTRADSPTLDG